MLLQNQFYSQSVKSLFLLQCSSEPRVWHLQYPEAPAGGKKLQYKQLSQSLAPSSWSLAIAVINYRHSRWLKSFFHSCSSLVASHSCSLASFPSLLLWNTNTSCFIWIVSFFILSTFTARLPLMLSQLFQQPLSGFSLRHIIFILVFSWKWRHVVIFQQKSDEITSWYRQVWKVQIGFHVLILFWLLVLHG